MGAEVLLPKYNLNTSCHNFQVLHNSSYNLTGDYEIFNFNTQWDLSRGYNQDKIKEINWLGC